MSVVEQAFCRSAFWRLVTRRVILPWALQGLRPHGELLELGAGSGAMAAGTARSFPDLRVTVTDVDPVMVEAARQRLAGRPGVRVEQADVTTLPFDDQSFDFVASYLMLHHVIDWHRALAEATRVLRPDGRIIGYDLTRTRVAQLIHWADRSPHRLIGVEEFEPAFEHAGLETVVIHQGLSGHVVRFAAAKPHAPPPPAPR